MAEAGLAAVALGGDGAERLSPAKRLLLEKCLRGEVPGTPATFGRRPPGATVPLSREQQLLWLHSQLAPDRPVYNEPITIHRHGALDVGALEKSLAEILRRHEAWRTSFAVVGGQPAQIVHPAAVFPLRCVDLRDRPGSERPAEALRLATEDARRPFDLARVPLVRALLVRLGEEEHRLYLTLHHIVFDGVSTYGVLLPELTALYEAYSRGAPSPLPELPVQYADYAWWQREAEPEAAPGPLAYWCRQLRAMPDLELPADRTRPPVQSFRGEMQPLVLSRELSEALRALSRREGVTLFMTLLASFDTLLHRYTGQDDIVVGTVSAGRARPEVQKLLGFFLNPLLVRADLSGDPAFRELMGRIRDVTLDALAHQGVPFERLVRELRPKRDPSRNPLYQVLFSLEPPMPALAPGWDLTQNDVETGTAKLDLYLELDDRPSGIVGRFMYSAELFDRATIVRLLAHWRTLLEGIVRDPDQRLSRLPMVSAEELRVAGAPRARERVDDGFVPFAREAIEQTMTDRFDAIAAAHADRVAVLDRDRPWTYAELGRAANGIARAILERCGPGEGRVALLLDHDALAPAAMLGVLKAGKAYVALDPRYPRRRLAETLDDAEPALLLTAGAHLALAAELAAGRLPVIDASRLPTRAFAGGPPVQPGALAYLLYTSGSTGRPKGVMQSHRNVLHFVRSYTNALRLRAGDRIGLIASYGFDAAVLDVFGALLNGATLCPIDVKGEGADVLRERLAGLGVTVYHSTPTVYRHFVRTLDGSEDLGRIRWVVLGGEEALGADVEACRRHFPRARFVNLAGQSESSLNLLHFDDPERGAPIRGSVPMGHPVEDTEVLLLSEDGQPTDLCGEMAIRSPHVALGYWRRPELTAEVFFPAAVPGKARTYRTGDRARRLSDGSLEFRGRADLQVKVRGVRVELGEVESALARHPAVKAAAAGLWEAAPGDRRLVAYWVAERPLATPRRALRDFLRETLPESMVPSLFVRLEALPQTPSGKLDRRALPVPDLAEAREEVRAVSPRDGVEAELLRIWRAVLGVASLGVEDDFFDLGGHSLLAVRLFSEVESAFGVRLPLATLFSAPTVERLAAVLRRSGTAPLSSLVPLQPAGTLPPFFGVHGHSGEVLFYRDLARRLGTDQPFFALQARGLEEGPVHESIEAMAAGYLAEVRTVQPRGPYLIGGYCFGALVATEMAHQLRAAGEEVGLLALFVGHSAARGRRPASLARLGARAARALGAEVMSWLRPDLPRRNLRAARRYAPRAYPGRMTVFLSGDVPRGYVIDPARDLGGLTARALEVVPVPGTTDTMMKEPHVGALAERLKASLDRAPAKELPTAS